MQALEEYRLRKGLDVWVVPEFAQKYLAFDPAQLQQAMEANYPVRSAGDNIEWARPQWVEGDNAALHYRGRELKRGKMWFQTGEPETPEIGFFVKYYYTGWQNAVLPATSNVERAPEMAAVTKKYNAWVEKAGYPAANHFILTHYVDGEHNIGMHFDKPKSIEKESLITVVKTGAHGRPFRLEALDGKLLMERVLEPGTAVIMTLEANLATKHGVPAVDEAGSSGSIVFRSITDRVKWSQLEKKLAKFDADKAKKPAGKKRKARD